MKKLLFTSFLIIALLSATNLVEAQSFSLIEDSADLSLCPGSTILVKTIVESNTQSTFTVSQDGDASRFSITVPSGFILSQGERKVIFSYITAPSTTLPGNYNLNLDVSTISETKRASYDITIDNCRSSSLIIDQVQNVCPAESVEYRAILKNNGRFTEDYILNVEGPASSWATLSNSFIRLAAGEQKEFNVFLNPPADIVGEFDFTVTAASNSRAFASATSKLNVESCYDYELSTEKALFSLCEADKLSVPLLVENNGKFQNNYELKLKAQRFINLEKDSVSLLPGQKEAVNLIINPSFGTQGDFPVEVEISSTNGNIRKLLALTSRIDQCYESGIEVLSGQSTVCNSFSNTKEVLIRNSGKFQNTFSLSVEGSDFVNFEKDSVSLSPGEEEIVNVLINPKEGTIVKDHEVTLVVTDPVSGFVSTDTFVVSTISKEGCFLPSLTSTQNSVEVAKDSSAAVSFTLENKGTKEGSYIFELSGNALSFVQINPSSIMLDSGQSETVFLHVAPPVSVDEGTYDLTITARLKDTTISSSNTFNIMVTHFVEKPFISPTGEVVLTPSSTPLDRLKVFFRNLFGITTKTDNLNTTQETVEVTEEKEEPKKDTDKEKTESIIEIKIEEEDLEENTKELNLTPELISEEQEKTDTKSFLESFKEFLFGQSSNQQKTNKTLDPVNEEEKLNENTTQDETTEEVIVSPKTSSSLSFRNLLSNYSYHLATALILLVIILIIASGYWKKIVNFFVEEEEVTKKNGNGKKEKVSNKKEVKESSSKTKSKVTKKQPEKSLPKKETAN